MDSCKFHDVEVEKSNTILRYRRIKRITALFRLLEVFVFLIILSRVPTDQFAFSFKIPSQFFRGISVTLISPRFVFIVGNAIIVVLFLISGQFSGGKKSDFYDEYVKKSRSNQQTYMKEEKKGSDCKYRVCYDEKKISRSHSHNLERAVRVEERRRDLRRSMSEKCRKSVGCGRKAVVPATGGSSPCTEDEMSGEEFRRKVEAFISRQQRFLREEEEFSAAVSV